MPTSTRAILPLALTLFMLAACTQSPAPQVQGVTDSATHKTQTVKNTVTLQTQAVTGGEVWAWGLNDFGQTTVFPYAGLSYTAIAAGSSHSVTLRSDGQIRVWGNPDPWGLWTTAKDGSTYIGYIPPLPSGMVYTAVAAGGNHGLALRSDGQAVGWGYNSDGQTTAPTLPDGMKYTAVEGGSNHSLALRSDGQVVAWGYNGSGQTNVPDLPSGLSYTAVAGGNNHSLALRSDGQVVAWGYGHYGQTTVPALPLGLVYTAVAGGGSHSLALRSDGQVVTWGYGGYGLSDVPALPSGMTYTAVSGGTTHSLALRSDGQVVAWGNNGSGQTTVPALPSGTKYTAISGGGNHSLALTGPLPRQDQTISLTAPTRIDARVGGSTTVGATATSGLEVTLSSSTPEVCTFAGGTVSFVAVGECTIAANQAGNESFNPAPEVTRSWTVSPPADTTAPTIKPSITGTLGQNGWYTSDVTVRWTVTDGESAVSARTGCDPTLLSSDTAAVTLTCEATSAGGSGSVSVTLKRDATKPSLAPVVTPNPVLLGSSATATSGATDATSGVASQSCKPEGTSSVGGKNVTCTATDNAGNTASANGSYRVVYGFEGFFSPVSNTALNTVRAGQPIPLKWRLTDARGAPVTGLSTVQVRVTDNCSAESTPRTTEESALGGLQNLGDGDYQFNWKTPRSYAGSCKTLQLDLGDGVIHTARFSFTR